MASTVSSKSSERKKKEATITTLEHDTFDLPALPAKLRIPGREGILPLELGGVTEKMNCVMVPPGIGVITWSGIGTASPSSLGTKIGKHQPTAEWYNKSIKCKKRRGVDVHHKVLSIPQVVVDWQNEILKIDTAQDLTSNQYESYEHDDNDGSSSSKPISIDDDDDDDDGFVDTADIFNEAWKEAMESLKTETSADADTTLTVPKFPKGVKGAIKGSKIPTISSPDNTKMNFFNPVHKALRRSDQFGIIIVKVENVVGMEWAVIIPPGTQVGSWCGFTTSNHNTRGSKHRNCSVCRRKDNPEVEKNLRISGNYKLTAHGISTQFAEWCNSVIVKTRIEEMICNYEGTGPLYKKPPPIDPIAGAVFTKTYQDLSNKKKLSEGIAKHKRGLAIDESIRADERKRLKTEGLLVEEGSHIRYYTPEMEEAIREDERKKFGEEEDAIRRDERRMVRDKYKNRYKNAAVAAAPAPAAATAPTAEMVKELRAKWEAEEKPKLEADARDQVTNETLAEMRRTITMEYNGYLKKVDFGEALEFPNQVHEGKSKTPITNLLYPKGWNKMNDAQRRKWAFKANNLKPSSKKKDFNDSAHWLFKASFTQPNSGVCVAPGEDAGDKDEGGKNGGETDTAGRFHTSNDSGSDE